MHAAHSLISPRSLTSLFCAVLLGGIFSTAPAQTFSGAEMDGGVIIEGQISSLSSLGTGTLTLGSSVVYNVNFNNSGLWIAGYDGYSFNSVIFSAFDTPYNSGSVTISSGENLSLLGGGFNLAPGLIYLDGPILLSDSNGVVDTGDTSAPLSEPPSSGTLVFSGSPTSFPGPLTLNSGSTMQSTPDSGSQSSNFNAVPEPSTYALIGLGALLLVGLHRAWRATA